MRSHEHKEYHTNISKTNFQLLQESSWHTMSWSLTNNNSTIQTSQNRSNDIVHLLHTVLQPRWTNPNWWSFSSKWPQNTTNFSQTTQNWFPINLKIKGSVFTLILLQSPYSSSSSLQETQLGLKGSQASLRSFKFELATCQTRASLGTHNSHATRKSHVPHG